MRSLAFLMAWCTFLSMCGDRAHTTRASSFGFQQKVRNPNPQIVWRCPSCHVPPVSGECLSHCGYALCCMISNFGHPNIYFAHVPGLLSSSSVVSNGARRSFLLGQRYSVSLPLFSVRMLLCRVLLPVASCSDVGS
jgi:hypothetical protein